MFLFALQCASATIFFDCTYLIDGWTALGQVYTCYPKVNQTGDTRNVVGVSQNHLTEMADVDVKGVEFDFQPIEHIPKDINLFFTNLEGFHFYGCPIKSFTADDLKPFPKLKSLTIRSAQLTTINGDVLKYSPALTYFACNDNQITNIGTGLFQHTPQLVLVNFENNMCISDLVRGVTAVALIGRELAFKCPPTQTMIEKVVTESERFQKVVNNQVEPQFAVINDELQKLKEENKKANDRIEVLEKFIFKMCAIYDVCS